MKKKSNIFAAMVQKTRAKQGRGKGLASSAAVPSGRFNHLNAGCFAPAGPERTGYAQGGSSFGANGSVSPGERLVARNHARRSALKG